MVKEENMTADNSAAGSSKSRYKKRKSVLEYVLIPVLFSAIALVVTLPAELKLFSEFESLVEAAESIFVKSEGDIQAGGAFSAENMQPGARIGTLVCEEAGVNEQIFYGQSRASLRNGLALSENGGLFGEDSCAYLTGYYTTALKSIASFSQGNSIIVKTDDTQYEYRVVAVTDNPQGTDADLIIACTQSENSIKGNYEGFVLAQLVGKASLQLEKGAQ